MFAAAFRFCLGSAFYTKRDITVRLGLPVYGMTFEPARRERDCGVSRRQAEMLAGGLSMLAQQYRKIVLLDAAQGQEASAFLEEITRRGLTNVTNSMTGRRSSMRGRRRRLWWSFHLEGPAERKYKMRLRM